ncbi:chitin-binding domain protein cbd-1-like [Mytilus galloprovincialis]|uniref:chitin-binding domain protein cbd-1-like n=1 Tax=Mytilus edulis TaxID=6550 RepID=UPI0039F08C99
MEYKPAVLFLIFLCYDVSFSADCIGLQDGNYQLNCQTYKACINGTAAVHNCPTPPALEIVFNNVTRKCDIPSNVALPCGGYHYDCSSKADGDYADLVTNCTSFAVCYSGKLAGYQHCAANLVFDAAIQTCNWVGRVPPPCGTKI